MSEWYYWYKDHGICPVCKKRDADEGYTTCLVCRMDLRAKGETHKTESSHRHQQWLKRRRDLCYAFGVCVTCEKRDAENGKSICKICAVKAKIRAEKRRQEKGIMPRNSYTKNGICFFCESPVLPGRKTCEKHYEICCSNMLKARNTPREENYFEKQNRAFWEEKNGTKIRNT